jgi:putative FmdB family regulatory protein
MPTYEYVCQKCEHTFELFQPIADDPISTCPKDKCAKKRWGKGKVKRAIGGGAGLIFKGSGFYITDYRSDSYKEAAKKDSAPATGSSGEKKSSPDSGKPAPKPDSKPKSSSGSKD